MPAPTAPLRPAPSPSLETPEPIPSVETNGMDVELPMIEAAPATTSQDPTLSPPPPSQDTAMTTDGDNRLHFPPSSTTNTAILPPSSAGRTTIPSTTLAKLSHRKIPVPPHRFTPLKQSWTKIYPPLVTHLNLQVRMNVAQKAVELRIPSNPPTTTNHITTSTSPTALLQKGADFLHAFVLGFDVDDAIALLRLDDLYIESFDVRDVKPSLKGQHLSRAIGRIAGKDGKTKFAIENTTKTRIVLADSMVHVLGGFSEGKIARESVVSLILGRSPSRVYGDLRSVAGRLKERY